MRRIVTIIAAVGLLQLVPALCVGGVITHACECAEEPCCPSACDCNDMSGCGHESDCADDPCSVSLVRPARQNADDSTAVQPTSWATIALIGTALPSARAEQARIPERPSRNNLSFPPSDLPLLV